MTPQEFASRIRNLIGSREKREAMQRAVLTVEAQAKREAPVKTGNLRRTITSRVERGGDRGVIGTNASYAKAVHDGRKEVIIRPKRAKALFWRGAAHPVKRVKQPPRKGNPFFERALTVARPRVERELAAWGDRLWAKVR
jgi:HK97 gp10 family phage protein